MSASASEPTWDILICSIWHRTKMLDGLLWELERQLRPGVGIIVCRDNLELSYGEKVNKLMAASSADYVNQIDDDDWPAAAYVTQITKALRHRRDYVGFKVKWTQDGKLMQPVYHSLAYYGWTNTDEMLTRDIVHFNPLRRDIAIQIPWEGGNGADRRWADGIRGLGLVKTQTYISKPAMLHYRLVLGDTFTVAREPLAEEPPLGDHPKTRFI